MNLDPNTPVLDEPNTSTESEDTAPGWETLSPEDYPNIDALVIEDGKPMDSIFAEKQARLLTEPLYNSWAGPGEGREFIALANVGLFFAEKAKALVPDVMLSLDVPANRDLRRKENRSYLMWVMGKPPNVVMEFVSDNTGGEEGRKHRAYARIGVTYYVVLDPRNILKRGVLLAFSLRDGTYEPIDPVLFPGIGLGVRLGEGVYEGHSGQWLRWIDPAGNLIPTGRERADEIEERARKAEDRIERLAAQLRAMGIEPKE